MPTVTAVFTATTTWTCPTGVTTVAVECWGGGKSGGNGTASSGAPGARGADYAKKNAVAVSAGTSYTVTVAVGRGGGSGLAGDDSWFGTTGTVFAKGAGSTGTNVGDTIHLGGVGGGVTALAGGGGGESGGPSADGHAGSAASGGTPGAGGTGTAEAGDGGSGSAANTNGLPGVVPGGSGGGGGPKVGGSNGGAGAAGWVRLVYTLPDDTGTVTDADAIAVTKPASDAVTPTESKRAAVTKPATDSTTIAEADVVGVTKPATDAVTATDAPSLRPVKPAGDSVAFADAQAIVAAFRRTIADGTTASDAADDLATFHEATDDTVALVDVPAKGLHLFPTDEIGAASSTRRPIYVFDD